MTLLSSFQLMLMRRAQGPCEIKEICSKTLNGGALPCRTVFVPTGWGQNSVGNFEKNSVQGQREVVQAVSKTAGHFFNKLKNALGRWSPSSPPQYPSKKNVNRCPDRAMPANVHSHASHGRHKAKTACTSIHRFTDPEDVVQLYRTAVLGPKKQWPRDTCYSVADP